MQTGQKFVGRKGEYHIGKTTSAMIGELITDVVIVCANGNDLPPVWGFPHQRFDLKGINEGPMWLAHHSGFI